MGVRMAWVFAGSFLLVGSIPGEVRGEEESARGSDGFRGSQIQIRLGDRQFQASVIARDGDRLTLLTAAHCLADLDEGAKLRITQGGEGFGGRLLDASRNPAFRPIPTRDGEVGTVQGVLGVDHAIALIRAMPVGATEASRLLAIRPASLAKTPILGAGAGIVTVHIIDQFGEEHVVRAGNHLQPKCLAWGRGGFQPVPGDSGAGVFLMVPDPGGDARPLLIGNVAISDERGGIAPLICRRDLWVEIGPGGGSPSEAKRP